MTVSGSQDYMTRADHGGGRDVLFIRSFHSLRQDLQSALLASYVPGYPGITEAFSF